MVECLDKKIQQIFQGFISTVKGDESCQKIYSKVVAEGVYLDKDSMMFLGKISGTYYKFKTFVTKCTFNQNDNAKYHFLYPHIFDHKDLYSTKITIKWTPDNPYINGAVCHPSAPLYDSKRHFKKDWLAAQKQQGTDVVIKVGNQKWTVHSVRLCAHSKYFECMFQRNFMEKLDNKNEKRTEVDLKEDTPQVIGALLKFIYLGSLDMSEIQEIDMLELYTAACKYEVEELRYFCADRINDYLQTNEVSNEEFCNMLKMGLSKVMMGQDLLKVCLAHAETNERLQTVFVNVINSEAFDKEKDFFPLLEICREMNCHNMVTQLKDAI